MPCHADNFKTILPGLSTEAEDPGDYLRRKRPDLGLLQREVAERLGVDKTTIWIWEESDRSSPAPRFITKVIERLKYVPDCTKSLRGVSR